MIKFTLKKKTIDGEDRVSNFDKKYVCAIIAFASAAYMGFNNIDGLVRRCSMSWIARALSVIGAIIGIAFVMIMIIICYKMLGWKLFYLLVLL